MHRYWKVNNKKEEQPRQFTTTVGKRSANFSVIVIMKKHMSHGGVGWINHLSNYIARLR